MNDHERTPTEGDGGVHRHTVGRPDDAVVERLRGSTLDHQATDLYAGASEQREQSWQALQHRQRRAGRSRNLMFAAAACLVVLIGAAVVQQREDGSDGTMASVGGDSQPTMSTTPQSMVPAPALPGSATTVPGAEVTTTSTLPATTSTTVPVTSSTTASSGPAGPGGPSGSGEPSGPTGPQAIQLAQVDFGPSACFPRLDYTTSPATVRLVNGSARFTATPTGGGPSNWILHVDHTVAGDFDRDGVQDLAVQVRCGQDNSDYGWSYLAIVNGALKPPQINAAVNLSQAPVPTDRTYTEVDANSEPRQVPARIYDTLDSIKGDGHLLRTSWRQLVGDTCCGNEYREVTTTFAYDGGPFPMPTGAPVIGPWIAPR